MAFGDRHLQRNAIRAVTTGPYAVFTLTPFAASATPGGVTTTFRLSLPFDCRVQEVSVATQSSSGGAARPSLQITDGTNNLLAGTAFGFTSAGASVATPTSTAGTLVAAQRNRLKGDILQFAITSLASEAIVGCTIALTVQVTGFVAASEADD